MSSPHFSSRSTQTELMDQHGVSVNEIEKALKELEIINTRLGGYKVTLDAIEKISDGHLLHIVDYGCGGGDVLRTIYDWGQKNNLPVKCTGVDINPVMIEYCRKKNGSRAIDYRQLSIWDEELIHIPCDVVVNSLFCHHFDDKELVALIKRMNVHAKQAVIINDLHRHPVAYYSIKLLTKLFSSSYLVKNDGPLSVERSLRKSEWEEILRKADITKYSIKWYWAFRWQVFISSDASD